MTLYTVGADETDAADNLRVGILYDTQATAKEETETGEVVFVVEIRRL